LPEAVSHIVSREMATTIHLNPATDVAERVLLPGDPQRALAVAQALLESPRMLNARRGLWGYTGIAPDGGLLTIQSTGMGGPSAAIVVEELIELGARTLIRIGTCGALVDGLELGELLAATGVIAADGTSRALGSEGSVEPDAALTEALVELGHARPARIVSTDLFYDPREDRHDVWTRAGAEAVEMEAATVLAVAARHGVQAACLLAVTDQLATNGRVRMDQDEIEAVGIRLGEAALQALARTL
jgi:DeoD family purine-nucleoside phosphorylase